MTAVTHHHQEVVVMDKTMAAAPKILPVRRVKATVTVMMNVWDLSFVEAITAHGEIEMTAVWHYQKVVVTDKTRAAAPKILPVKRAKATVTVMINVWDLSFVETLTAHGEIVTTAVRHHRKTYSEII